MKSKIKIGCCGFPVSRERYFRAFGAVEVQQTFYQPPSDRLAEKWRAGAPKEFEYTLKAWQLITHEPSSPTYRKLKAPIDHSKEEFYGSFKPTDEVFAAWERTREIAGILRARIIVFQCPPGFAPSAEHKKNMRRFFSSIRRDGFIFAWEPRGAWKPDEIRHLCQELDLVPVVDPFKDDPQYGNIRYIRLHGRGGYRYKYTDEDLAALKRLTENGKETYVMFNNVFMYDDALAFEKMLGSEP
jgi:uncharacterized protein YecE (DUF72 family)